MHKKSIKERNFQSKLAWKGLQALLCIMNQKRQKKKTEDKKKQIHVKHKNNVIWEKSYWLICNYLWWRCRAVICHLLLCGSQCHSHHHLQGQGGGGGASCGEGGHHHLRVDGLLPLLRVHAQHRHLRQGQMAGMLVLLLEARGGLNSVCESCLLK